MNGHLQLAEAMRRQGQAPGYVNSMPRQATISSYDPATHAVKVLLQPEGIESNWMPLGAIGVGNGWGIVCGPQVGDQVHVSFAEGDFHSGIVVGRVYSTSATAPAAPSGETWMVHQNGTLIKLLNNGDLQVVTDRDLNLTTGRDANVTVTNNANVTVGGNVNLAVTGNITSSAAQWTHTGPVSIVGTLNVKLQITGTGGFGITTQYGNVGGYAASISGNVNAINGMLTGSSWGINLTGADIVVDGYSLKLHHHSNSAGNTGGAIP